MTSSGYCGSVTGCPSSFVLEPPGRAVDCPATRRAIPPAIAIRNAERSSFRRPSPCAEWCVLCCIVLTPQKTLCSDLKPVRPRRSLFCYQPDRANRDDAHAGHVKGNSNRRTKSNEQRCRHQRRECASKYRSELIPEGCARITNPGRKHFREQCSQWSENHPV